MTLQQLTYLVKVAECGNITDAAEQLYSFAVNAFVDVVNAFDADSHRLQKYPATKRSYLVL